MKRFIGKIRIFFLILLILTIQGLDSNSSQRPLSNNTEPSRSSTYWGYFLKFDGETWDTTDYPNPITILGSGTPENPYIIQNVIFPASEGSNHFTFISIHYNSSSTPKSIKILNCTFPHNSAPYYLSYPISAWDDDYLNRSILSSYLEINNCTFRNVAYNTPSCYLKGLQNTRIINCDIREMVSIYLSGCENTSITDNYFYNCDGIDLGSNNTEILRNTFLYMQSTAIDFRGVRDDVRIESNKFLYGSTPIDLGGYFSSRDGYYSGSSDIIVRNNTIEYSGGNTIDGMDCNNITIEENLISTSSESGIWLAGSEDVSIVGNNISNCVDNGIFIKDSKYITIENNHIADSGKYGVWSDGNKKRSISENTFDNNAEGDIHYTSTFGEMYLNKSVGEITVFWVGLTYIVSIFVMYGYREKIKKFFKLR